MTIVTDSTGAVRMYSEAGVPEAEPGYAVVTLGNAQAAAFLVACGQPNGGVVFDGTTFRPLPVPVPAVVVPPAPTFGLLPAAGAGATGNVASGSNDLLMAGSIHTGTTPTAGDFLTVTFGTPRAAAPLGVSVQAQNVQAGTLIAKNITATGFTISTSAVPAANATYGLLAHVMG